MKYNHLDPESTVKKLYSHVYSAAQLIEATDITPAILTNYLTKAKITLCSESKGRGNSRRFHLLDIYMISLMKALVDLTGRQDWSARTLEYLLFLPNNSVQQQEKALQFGPELSIIREKFLSSMHEVKPLFYQRKWHDRSWVLFAEAMSARNNLYGCHLFQAGERTSLVNDVGFLISGDDGYYLNITSRLSAVDQRLCKIVGNDIW